MAALCTGISYGLSQSCLSNENKELIFVKLTDSAYRAIEEYQKNQVSTKKHFSFLIIPYWEYTINQFTPWKVKIASIDHAVWIDGIQLSITYHITIVQFE